MGKVFIFTREIQKAIKMMRINMAQKIKDSLKMNLITFRSLVVKIILLSFSINSYGQEGTSYSKGKIKHRISAGPVISIFKNDPHYSIDTKAKAGANVAYKAEILLGRKTNIIVGLEYMGQGLKFHGYYADSGHTYLYDGSFSYLHEIRYNEIHAPLGLKLALNNEKESPVTPYLFGGIGARCIFGSYVVISSDSTETTPYDGKGTVDFEHQRIYKKLNGFYYGGIGIQKNARSSAKAMFLELTFKRGFSRIHYTGYKNSNNVYFRDNNLAITVGLRF